MLLFGHSVMSDSLQPRGLQHAKLPWPSPPPRIFSNSSSIELVMPANHLILCHPLLLLPSSNTLAIWQNLSRELRFNPSVVLSTCISQQIKPSHISPNISFCSFHTDHTLRSINTFFLPSEHNAIYSVNAFQIITTFFSEPKVRLL